jgi:hypothetical protein
MRSAADGWGAWVVLWAPLGSEADAFSGLADGELFPLFHHTNTAANRITMVMMIDFLGFMGGGLDC